MAPLFHNWKIIFKNIENKIRLLNKDSAQKYNPYNLSTFRSSKGRVMVKWTDGDNKKAENQGGTQPSRTTLKCVMSLGLRMSASHERCTKSI